MDLNIPESETTPGVSFDPQTSTLTLRGESYPENPAIFFDPICEWIESFVGPGAPLNFQLLLFYLNTGSTMGLKEILRVLEKKQSLGAQISVTWNHLPDLEIMRQAGQELLFGTPLPHTIAATEEI